MIWFLTDNFQILDLTKCKNFWIEECVKTNNVFCRDNDDIDWNIADFKNLEDAHNYMYRIFQILEEIEKE